MINVAAQAVPQAPPPGAVPQDAQLGQVSRILADYAQRQVGGAGVVSAEMHGQNVKEGLKWFAPVIVQHGIVQGVQQAVQQAMQQAMQPIQASLAAIQATQQQQQASLAAIPASLAEIREMVVGGYNLSGRLHNRGVDAGAPGIDLVPLRKVRHPVALHPAPFGALPPAGMFPADLMACHQLTHLQLDALSGFYDEDFGQQGVHGIEMRRRQFENFIKRM